MSNYHDHYHEGVLCQDKQCEPESQPKRRLEREEFWMEVAKLCARRSTCNRLQVGAVIADLGRIISTGYNGAPKGFSHCDPVQCRPDGPPCTRTVHAEANAIAFAARSGISVNQSFLITTESPCMECAKLIINSGIRCVIYLNLYRDTKPIDLIKDAGLFCRGYLASR